MQKKIYVGVHNYTRLHNLPMPTANAKTATPQSLREAMVLTAARWLPQRGMAAVNLIEVARAVSAPRGSIYHYFPGGRDQLLNEALELSGKSGLRIIEKALRVATPSLEGFVWAIFSNGQLQINASNFSGGCPVGAAILSSETESADLQQALQKIFSSWHTALVTAFMSLGAVDTVQAVQWARCTLMAYEGALVCAKAEQDKRVSAETFDLAAQMVLLVLKLQQPVRKKLRLKKVA